jgi:Zn-dependent M28 family amino/carboxypeptidase
VAAVDIDRVMQHVASLQALGVRARGSDAERSAAEYIRLQLSAMGYEPRVEEFPLTEGTRSSNVIATASGADPRVIVLGAHMDSKSPSPGANDNGTGCALLLELARAFRDRPHAPTIEFVFFGAEESRGDPEDHHVGSAFRVESLSPAEKARIAGMISVDMIGVGTRFHARTMGLAPSTMSDAVLAEARRQDIRMSYLADPGRSGWSDHGPFELAGIPAVWIEWRDDTAYHTAQDTSARLNRAHLQQAGELLGGLLGRLDGSGLDVLTR